MNLNEYQELALRTRNEEIGTVQELANYALGLTGESGEVADMIKKAIFQGHELDRHELAKELGDCMWYIANLSKVAGFTLDEIATMNVTKLLKRYPNGFSHERSVNRDE